MEIVCKYGANYFVCKSKDYKPIKETLFFGETKITPGTKIKKIGEISNESGQKRERCYGYRKNRSGSF